ncbi:hypothetical protein [Coralliovum pocilloporae]|uniref:hypothetical protein n=1 Tax=Coralliovum pocilloporae TaxID=3066369 RepID=UPI003306B1E9
MSSSWSRFIGLIVMSFAVIGLSVGSSHAAQLTWKVKSNHPNKVSVVFYSQTYDHAWPGGSKVYVISDYKTHTYRLNCRRGEKICYGAWVRGNSTTYWGVGQYNQHGCRGCCYTCGGGTTKVQVLNP